MKHSRFGLILLLSSGSLLACNGDPTSSIRDNNPPQILSDPSVIFLTQGGSTFMTVELVDAQGNQLPATFDATSGGSQATVVRDTTFLQTTNGTNLNNQERFVVTSGDAGQTAITVTAGGATLDVPLTVVPTAFAATFSNATPAVNESVTLTAPSGYTFASDVAVLFGADTAVVNSVAADGSTLNFQVLPGTTGTATVAGVNVSFVPGAALTLPTVDAITASSTLPPPLGGTDAPGTAPTILAPGLIIDSGPYGYQAPILGGAFGTFPSRLYSFTIATDGDYNATLDWASGEDLGAYFFLPDGTTETGSPADANGAGGHPETSTSTFVAGTYLVAIVNFSGTDPASFTFKLTPAQ